MKPLVFNDEQPSMTKSPVIEALERITVEACVMRVDQPMTETEHEELLQGIAELAENALPLAREMVEKLERYERTSESGESLGGEMEYREALEWLASDFFGPTDIAALRARIDTPAIIREMLGDKHD